MLHRQTERKVVNHKEIQRERKKAKHKERWRERTCFYVAQKESKTKREEIQREKKKRKLKKSKTERQIERKKESVFMLH